MKKYILAFVIIILVGIAYLGYSAITGQPQIISPNNTNSATTTATSTIISTTSTKTVAPLSADQTEIDNVWSFFQKYLSFAKNNDIKGVASLSYQLSKDCQNYGKDATSTSNCKVKMQTIYSIGSEFKKKDFRNIWQDSKQIMLFTDFIRLDNETSAGLIHGIIYFVKDDLGNIKFLALNPTQGEFVAKAGRTEAELSKELEVNTKDTDKDGLEDAIELCQISGEICTHTDPNKRDSNGNGYWDGIENLFYK